ncbi:hypothetical protein MTO96_022830 [Rhipicephalus appendiculatus]
MFTNVDVRGVPRGRCGREQCECDGFTRSHTGAYGGASGWVHSGWCCYCGHPPVNHSRIERNAFGRQEILPVVWSGARAPTLDLPTRRECNGMLEAAQPTADEVIVLEPDEVRETAAPENETPEGIVQHAEEEQSDQNLGLKRKHSHELLPQQESGLEDTSSEKSPKESTSEKPRSTRSGLRNRQRRGTANSSAGGHEANNSSLVDIGGGVALQKEQLEKIWKIPKPYRDQVCQPTLPSRIHSSRAARANA